MEIILNQIRRMYADDGRNDKDFTDHEERLRQATSKVINATSELVRASERLNQAAIGVGAISSIH